MLREKPKGDDFLSLFPSVYKGAKVRVERVYTENCIRVILRKGDCNVAHSVNLEVFWSNNNKERIVEHVLEKACYQLDEFIAEEELKKAPKFKTYSSKWPLGPPGYFYNSAGTMCIIMEMKPAYVNSTLAWLKRTFDPNKHPWAYKKQKELEASILLKNNT